MHLNISAATLDDIIFDLAAQPEQVKKALRRTVSRMAKWLRVRAAKVARTQTGLKANQLRTRLKLMKFRLTADGVSGGVWIGLNPFDLSLLSPEQDYFGVSAGPAGRSQSYEGAFMGPKIGVTAKKLRGAVFKRKGRARLPIQRQEMPIKDDVESALDASVFAGFEAQFFKTFEHELKWQMR